MTAIGLGVMLLVLLIAVTDKDPGSYYAGWVKACFGAVFIVGLVLTIVGLLVWAWRTLP